jgi:ATP-dependent helicase HrpB
LRGVCGARAKPARCPSSIAPKLWMPISAALALDLAAWGVSDPAHLAWLDPPPKPAWNEAIALLKRIGALDAERPPHRARRGHRAFAVAARVWRTWWSPPHAMAKRCLAARIAIVLTEQGLGGRSEDLRARLHRFERERNARADGARALASVSRKMAGGYKGALTKITQAHPRAGLSGSCRQSARQWLQLGQWPRRDGSIEASRFCERNMPSLLTWRAPRVALKCCSARRSHTPTSNAMFGAQIETRASATIDPATGALRGRKVKRLGKLVLSEAPLERSRQRTGAGAFRCDRRGRPTASGLG